MGPMAIPCKHKMIPFGRKPKTVAYTQYRMDDDDDDDDSAGTIFLSMLTFYGAVSRFQMASVVRGRDFCCEQWVWE